MIMSNYLNTVDPRSSVGIIQGNPRPGLVDLGPGYLDPVLVPAKLIGQWAADALSYWGRHALAYGANAGPWELRVQLAARTAGCGPGNVMITGGTSAAIEHLAMRFAHEGRLVLTESLTYDLGRMIFTGWGVKTIAVPGPVDDLDVDQFRKAARRAVRSSGLPPAMYLIPTFHNPTGRVLSAERRAEICALAQEIGALIVEDHAYADLGYEAPPPRSLWSMAADPEQVITLYSFAKCLAPGLRVGWLTGGERLVAELTASPVRMSGGGPNHFSAMVVMAGLVNDQVESHVSALRDQLRLRRDALIPQLVRQLPEDFTVARPAGGFFTWIGLPGGVSDEALLRTAEQRGVSFAVGRRFGVSGGGVRLCFACSEPDRLWLGAARFADACRSAVGAG
jgi:2-aminoadipate transaminase